MGGVTPLALIQIVSYTAFLWLGLYLLRTGGLKPLILVGCAGLFGIAAFFASSAIGYALISEAVLTTIWRWTWWTAVLPAAAWFHFCSLLARLLGQEGSRSTPVWTLPVLLVYATAALISLLAATTDVIVSYSAPTGDPRLFIVPGPGIGYPAYIVFQAVAAGGALLYLLRALRSLPRRSPAERDLRQQLRLLLAGGALFLAGALWISIRYYLVLDISLLPSYGCLLAGAALIGYGIAFWGLLLEGIDVRRDFAYSLTGILILNSAYLALLAATGGLSVWSLLALASLVTLTHTAFDGGRALLDRLFFSRDEQAARAEAREYATSLGTAPIEAPVAMPVLAAAAEVDQPVHSTGIDDLKEFRTLVRRAISALRNPPQLAQSPLLALPLVGRRVAEAEQKDSRLTRVASLRELLIEQIEDLRPAGGLANPTGDAWRFYNVLYYPYVKELSRKAALSEARRIERERERSGASSPGELEQVLYWLADVDEDTFYKWQRRASDTIATILWEENRALE